MPTFITDITNLLKDAAGWITGLAAASGGVMLSYHAIMRNFNDDPQMVAHHTGSMKKVLWGAGIATAASGIVTALLTYFH